MGKTSRKRHNEEIYAGIDLSETIEKISIEQAWTPKAEWTEANKDNPDAVAEKKDQWLEIHLVCEIIHTSRLTPPDAWKRSSVSLLRIGRFNYAAVLAGCEVQLAGQNEGIQ